MPYADPRKKRENNRKRWLANSERIGESNRKWALAHPEKMREYRRAWRKRNPGCNAKTKAWVEVNRARANALWRAWRKNNKHRVAAWRKAREALKLNAMPPWADKRAIEAVYALARARTEETGVKHHVDHIVPLKHPKVCGLHVSANLQVISAAENCRKSNRFEVRV